MYRCAGTGRHRILADAGQPYVTVNGNQPFFDDEEKKRTDSFEMYSELDSLGRCGTAYANLGKELMPEEERGQIGQIRPSGWHTVKYSDLIEDRYLYNRCHLIGYALAGEGISFHVYCYNVQPGIEIDYMTGESRRLEESTKEDTTDEENTGRPEKDTVDTEETGLPEDTGERAEERTLPTEEDPAEETFILNTNSMKIHLPTCDSVKDMKEKNRKEYTGTIRELKEMGYRPCRLCLAGY